MLSESYLENPRMSQSKLKKILDGVEEFKWHLDNPPEETDAMKLGSAVHLLLLQPEKSKLVVPMPKFDGRTKKGKIIKSFIEGENIFSVDAEEEELLRELVLDFPNRLECIWLAPDQYRKAHAMVESIRQNSDAMQIVNCCYEFETERFFNYNDIDFKAQLDGVGSKFVLDVKSTRIENKEYQIKNEILNRKYHFQAALYLQATGWNNYFIIFVRNEPPYAVFPVKLSQEILDSGRYLLDEACEIYKDCLKNNPTFQPNNRLRII